MWRVAIIVTLLIIVATSGKAYPLPSTPLSTTSNHTPEEAPVLIAAAADLKFAMDSLIKAFASTPGHGGIKTVFGSSGNFFEQITNAAPFDIFFSADLDYPNKLKEKHLTIGEVITYGTGEVVIYSKKLDPAKTGMNSLLDPTITKIAIANPAHSPYGKRAEESLKYYKLYDRLKDKIVTGENISQTAEYVRTGTADIGIIALSLALSPAMQQDGGKYWIIPSEAHQPLRQGYTLLQHAKDNKTATAFIAFIQTKQAKAILQYFGFKQTAG